MADTLTRTLPQLIAQAAEPLPEIDDPAFGAMFDRFGDARVVLLGEASHGTSEFYRARAAITRRLVERHGFTIVAVEADWPDAATIDRYVRHREPRDGEQAAFERFPTWMWRNVEVDAFVRWLRGHNAQRPYERMCGFYGLDLYNLSASMRAVIDFLEEQDPEARPHRPPPLRVPRTMGGRSGALWRGRAERRLCALRIRRDARCFATSASATSTAWARSATSGWTPRPTPGS